MERNAVRILFAGNPSISVPSLKALAQVFQVVGVLTNPDRPTGRGKHLEAPAVKVAAEELGLPVLQYEHLLQKARTEIAALHPDILVSFACGHYFGPKFLALFPLAAINIHPSLLPHYRGCAPIQCALLNGEPRTGITIQRIAPEMDTGSILDCRIIELDGTETSVSLTDTVAELSAGMIVSTIQRLCAGTLQECAQDTSGVSYSTRLGKQDGVIDWHRQVRVIHSMVRAFQLWPKTTTSLKGVPLTITSVHGPLDQAGLEPVPPGVLPGTVVEFVKGKGLAIACGDGLLYVDRLQLAMKKELDSASFINGNPGILGAVLGD